MNRTTDALQGSPGHAFEVKKVEDGTFEVSSPSIEGKIWKGDSEIDAIRTATKDTYEMSLRGEI